MYLYGTIGLPVLDFDSSVHQTTLFRYVYQKGEKQMRARLQELGPRFTLKLRWLQVRADSAVLLL
jgi:hypothetical protein